LTEVHARLATDDVKSDGGEQQAEQRHGARLDVRQQSEYQAGHISGALNIELGELQAHLDGLPRELPVVTVCASGMRSTIAGSILLRDGRTDTRVVDELGSVEWIARRYPSTTGEE
jgi:rhodanese-related sulfurtransferase